MDADILFAVLVVALLVLLGVLIAFAWFFVLVPARSSGFFKQRSFSESAVGQDSRVQDTAPPSSSDATDTGNRAPSDATDIGKEQRQEAKSRNITISDNVGLLWRAPVMSRVPAQLHVKLAEAGALTSCRRGDVLAGGNVVDELQSLLLISAGEAAVMLDARRVATLRRGDCVDVGGLASLGELAFLEVVADSDMTCLQICRETYEEVGLPHYVPACRAAEVGAAVAKKLEAVCRVEALRCLLLAERLELAFALAEPRQLGRGEALLRPGQEGAQAFVLSAGEVSLARGDAARRSISASEPGGPAWLLNEHAVLDIAAEAEALEVSSETAEVLELDVWQLAPGTLAALRTALRTVARVQWHVASMEKVGLIGCGGFGKVVVYKHASTEAVVAVKSVSKGYTVKTGMQASILNEKTILNVCGSPFIVALHGTDKDSQWLHFILEPLLGGELYSTYKRKGFHGSEVHARYYIASVTLALEHLHGQGIVCRGIKPEDICLDSRGNAKLIDMGLAKLVSGLTYTTCGTPDYFAPEVVAGKGHGPGYDWWALGVLLFELLAGHPPFESAAPMQIYSKIMKGIGKVSFPQKCRSAQPLVAALMQQRPDERLPLQPGGLARLKAHAWFGGFDWLALAVQSLAPPYVPSVSSPTDISNFDARAGDAPPTVPYRDDGSGWDSDF